MVYRYDDGSIITGFQKEACEFAYNELSAKTEGAITLDTDEYSARLSMLCDYGYPPANVPFIHIIEWQDVRDFPEPHPEEVYGWDIFIEEFEKHSGGLRLMLMASGAVYSYWHGNTSWQYEFDAVNDGFDDEYDPDTGACNSPYSVPWPVTWLEHRYSDYMFCHDLQLKRAVFFGTEYDFFIKA